MPQPCAQERRDRARGRPQSRAAAAAGSRRREDRVDGRDRRQLPDDLPVAAGRQGGRAGLPGRGRHPVQGPDGLDDRRHSAPRREALARRLYAEFEGKACAFADAPIARTRQAAIDGTLSIMVGGTAETFARIEPLLRHLASEVTHCGDAGAGQAVKILNNMILFQTVVALAEALTIGRANGIDGKILYETLTKGSADSFALRNHGMKAMLPGVFPERAFSTDYALKDLSYAIQMAEDKGVPALGADVARELMERAEELGYSQGILAGPDQGDRGRHEEVEFMRLGPRASVRARYHERTDARRSRRYERQVEGERFMARIAVGDSSTRPIPFAPQQATWEEFVRADAWPPLLRGPEMIAGVEGFNIPIAGAVKRLAELGHEIVPLAWAAAAPASYVTEDAYERMWALFDEDIRKQGPFDAIYLDLHGAMVAENTEDGEGELLRRIRGIVGNELPIVASLDYHAEPHARDGPTGDGTRGLSHLSAHRHGGHRQARRRAARQAAQGEAAGLSRATASSIS